MTKTPFSVNDDARLSSRRALLAGGAAAVVLTVPKPAASSSQLPALLQQMKTLRAEYDALRHSDEHQDRVNDLLDELATTQEAVWRCGASSLQDLALIAAALKVHALSEWYETPEEDDDCDQRQVRAFLDCVMALGGVSAQHASF